MKKYITDDKFKFQLNRFVVEEEEFIRLQNITEDKMEIVDLLHKLLCNENHIDENGCTWNEGIWTAYINGKYLRKANILMGIYGTEINY